MKGYKNIKKGSFFLLLFLLAIPLDSMSQYRKNFFKGGRVPPHLSRTYLTMGISVNALNYFGDLAPKSQAASTDISSTRPGLGGFLEYKLGPSFFVYSSLSWGRIQGDDYQSADPDQNGAVGRYLRNLSFRNDIKELSIGAKVMLFPNFHNYLRRPVINPYIKAGIAVFHHNPKAKLPEVDAQGNTVERAGEWVALQPLGTEGQYSNQHDVDPYNRIQFSIPVGIGVNYAIAQNIDLGFEVSARYLFFDYLDDVSGEYVDKGALDGRIAKLLSDRSGEPTAVMTGESRNLEQFREWRRTYEASDGHTYVSFGGAGRESAKRGGSGENDFYTVTSVTLKYVIGSRSNYRRRR